MSSVSRLAMIPEPTTAITRNAVPIPSAARRRVQASCQLAGADLWSVDECRPTPPAPRHARVGQQQRVVGGGFRHVPAAQPVALEVSHPIVGASASTV